MNDSIVSVVKVDYYRYPDSSEAFRPSIKYPEYLFEEVAKNENVVYNSVREALHLLKMDEENYGAVNWNPLKNVVKPNDYVLLKPNLVMDYNHNKNGGVECLFTQPSVVASVIDYVLIALKETGKIVIGDAPMQECKFQKLVADCGYDKLIEYYRNKGIDIELVDLRELKSVVKKGIYYSEINDKAIGIIVNLDENSEFYSEEEKTLLKMRVTNYDPRLMNLHHNKNKHEYNISNYVLNSNVIINIPKPKTHRKAGVTIALKNFVGINVRKEFLPHHTKGGKNNGGDEYHNENPIHSARSYLNDKKNICEANYSYKKAKVYKYGIRICSILLELMKNKYSEGSWYGNDTISRTITDLNKIVLYADKNGVLHDSPVRKIFILADMIISGEREGPVAPSPKNVGIIAAGTNPVCFDEAICTIMGFDILKIPTLKRVRGVQNAYQIVDDMMTPLLVSNDIRYDKKHISELTRNNLLNYIPSTGWDGHIELS
ncbi:MAG: DUF362 domain-containing protein [Peptostreptococcaceae bacterium]|nr:DUF362 domain-containing protein [Peptostreptococcaceae bacterium]